MNRDQLQAEILDLMAEVTETESMRDDVATSFMEGGDQEGAPVDSLMALEIVAALEKKYKITINEEDLPKLATLDDTVDLIEQLLKEKQKAPKGPKKANAKPKAAKKK